MAMKVSKTISLDLDLFTEINRRIEIGKVTGVGPKNLNEALDTLVRYAFRTEALVLAEQATQDVK